MAFASSFDTGGKKYPVSTFQQLASTSWWHKTIQKNNDNNQKSDTGPLTTFLLTGRRRIIHFHTHQWHFPSKADRNTHCNNHSTDNSTEESLQSAAVAVTVTHCGHDGPSFCSLGSCCYRWPYSKNKQSQVDKCAENRQQLWKTKPSSVCHATTGTFILPFSLIIKVKMAAKSVWSLLVLVLLTKMKPTVKKNMQLSLVWMHFLVLTHSSS